MATTTLLRLQYSASFLRLAEQIGRVFDTGRIDMVYREPLIVDVKNSLEYD